jgi:hypothetical protein
MAIAFSPSPRPLRGFSVRRGHLCGFAELDLVSGEKAFQFHLPRGEGGGSCAAKEGGGEACHCRPRKEPSRCCSRQPPRQVCPVNERVCYSSRDMVSETSTHGAAILSRGRAIQGAKRRFLNDAGPLQAKPMLSKLYAKL